MRLSFIYRFSEDTDNKIKIEHAEIIVRYPQIVTNGCYENDIVKQIYKLIADYFTEVIEPKMNI